jgi:hypothetical protein
MAARCALKRARAISDTRRSGIRRRARPGILRRLWLQLRLPLLLPQLPLPLFLFLRQVMPDGASGHGADDRMVAGHMSGDGTDGGALDATSCLGLACASQNCRSRQRDHQDLQYCSPCHVLTP